MSDPKYLQGTYCVYSVFISDHFPVGLSWKTKYFKTTKTTAIMKKMYGNFANVDVDDLSSCISKRLSTNQLDDIDINVQINALESVIKEEMNRQVQFVKRGVKLKKQPLWFTDEIHRNISLSNECKDKGTI